jgi:D-galactarolactone cycloisomerase
MTGNRAGGVPIAAINGYVVRCRLPEPQGNASGFYDTRESLVIELVGSNGVSGWGETWHSPGAAAELVRRVLAAAVLGADATEPRPLRSALLARRGYDRGGVASMAISAIEMAAWDLAARTAQRPIAALLGGALRRKVLAYAAGPYFKPGAQPYRSYADEAEAYARCGFRAHKAKNGLDPRSDAVAVAAMRGAVGNDMALMVDANQGYTARAAIESARRIADHGVTWFEEPVLPEDLPGYRRFSAESPVAAAGGEALGELHAFADLLAAGVDVVEPDLSICGGFAAALEVATLAQAFGVALVPHVWGTGINLHATLQLLAVLPSAPSAFGCPYPWLELDRTPNPLRTVWGEPRPGSDGHVEVPDGPGLGIDIRPDHLQPFIQDRWSVTE